MDNAPQFNSKHYWEKSSLYLENYYIPSRRKFLGQTNKQPLSNIEPQKTWKHKQLWGLKLDPSCFYKKV